MPAHPVSFRLDDVRGHSAVLLLFAPSERSPAYENQIILFEEEALLDRLDAAFVVAFSEGSSQANGEQIDATSADELRTAFGVEGDDFMIVLIGADGKERHRDDSPLQPAVIIERLS